MIYYIEVVNHKINNPKETYITYVLSVRRKKDGQSWLDFQSTKDIQKAKTWKSRESALHTMNRLGTFLDNCSFSLKERI